MPLVIIESVPTFPEQVSESTPFPRVSPSSGGAVDIPLQLRHVEPRVSLEPFGKDLMGYLGFATEPAASSSVEGAGKTEGTLYISTHLMYWYSSDLQRGFSVDYASIVLHAISRARAEEDGSKSAIYLQLELGSYQTADGDFVPVSRSNENDDGHDEDDDGDEGHICELKLYPANHASVDDIFMALTGCVSLYPCIEEHEDAMDTGDAGTFFDEDNLPFEISDPDSVLKRFEDSSEGAR